MHRRLALVATLLTLAGCGSGTPEGGEPGSPAESAAPSTPTTSPSTPSAPAAPPSTPEPTGEPRLQVDELVTGLDHPWDVRALDEDRLLLTQRDRATLTLWQRGEGTRDVPLRDHRIWVSGETGLMGLEVDPGFAQNRRIYTCSGWETGSGTDVRVTAWTLDRGLTAATPAGTLVSGLPTTSGRHGGCRLLIASDGSMYVGTGDAADEDNPRNLDSLGGKVLRIDPATGAPWPGNPWADARGGVRPLLFSFGHRNVQGLAERADGEIWEVEHGTFRDDEVNRLVAGGDYGYQPGPGYDESVPMTDQELPGEQVEARWSSGEQTIATSGATFLPDTGWGSFDGALAVAVQKDQQLLLLRFEGDRRVRTWTPSELQFHGRLRTAEVAPDGSLLVTTDNGGGEDLVLRVTPEF